MEQYKTCTKCLQSKINSKEFFVSKKEKLLALCVECNRQRVREWRLKNLEKVIDQKREYYKNNKEYFAAYRKKRVATRKDKRVGGQNRLRDRALDSSLKGNRLRTARINANQKSQSFTVDDVLNTYGNTCHLCGLQIDLNAPRWMKIPGWQAGLHIDHVIPIVAGGPHNLENVRPSHGGCNLSKGYKKFL